MEKSNKLGILAVILGNSIFGFSFLFSKIALDITIPSVLIASRFAVAFALLNLVVLIGRVCKNPEGKQLISFSLKGKPRKQIILLALFQPVIYFIAENYGIVYTSSSFAGIIIALIPIAGIILDRIFFKAHITFRQIICAAVSIIGVFLTTIGAGDRKTSGLGLGLLLIAVLAGAMFYVFSKKSADFYNPLERTYVMFGIGTVFYVCLALIQCVGKYGELILEAYKTPAFWGCIAYLSGVSSVIAFLLLNYGSTRVSVAKATMLANLTTVISVFAGVIVLKEKMTIFQLLGAIIIILSVYFATAKKESSK